MAFEAAVCLILGLTLTKFSSFGWGGNEATILSCATLFCCNVALVALLRARCRAGVSPLHGQPRAPADRPGRLRRGAWQWLARWRGGAAYRLLRIPVRLVIFFSSFTFATTSFMVSAPAWSRPRGAWWARVRPGAARASARGMQGWLACRRPASDCLAPAWS